MEQSRSLITIQVVQVDEYEKWLVLVVDRAEFSCGRKRNER
jgi:hypothetical protein